MIGMTARTRLAALTLVAPLAFAAPAAADTWRDTVLANVEARTEARLEARVIVPAGELADERLALTEARLTIREEIGAPRLRPDVRLIRRGTRLDTRLGE